MAMKFLVRPLAVAFLFLCGAASAEVMTFRFSGTVTYSTYLAAPGDVITGEFSYETSHNPRRKDLPPGYNHEYADYYFQEPFIISATVGKHTIVTRDVGVQVFNNNGGHDLVDVYGGPAIVDGKTDERGYLSMRLMTDYGQTGVLHNTRLPRSYDVSEYDPRRSGGTLQTNGGQDGTLLNFTIDAIEVVGGKQR